MGEKELGDPKAGRNNGMSEKRFFFFSKLSNVGLVSCMNKVIKILRGRSNGASEELHGPEVN